MMLATERRHQSFFFFDWSQSNMECICLRMELFRDMKCNKMFSMTGHQVAAVVFVKQLSRYLELADYIDQYDN